jgi:hypothetical protein
VIRQHRLFCWCGTFINPSPVFDFMRTILQTARRYTSILDLHCSGSRSSCTQSDRPPLASRQGVHDATLATVTAHSPLPRRQQRVEHSLAKRYANLSDQLFGPVSSWPLGSTNGARDFRSVTSLVRERHYLLFATRRGLVGYKITTESSLLHD